MTLKDIDDSNLDYEKAQAIAASMSRKYSFLSIVKGPSKGFVGRESEVNSVMESLYKRRMANCILVGGAGVGKTEIAKKAMSILSKKRYGAFLDMSVYSANAGCTLVGMFEQKVQPAFEELAAFNAKSKCKIVLFIDEVHSLWIANRNDTSGTIPLSDILKPYLSEGTISIIGATTPEEYAKYVKTDKALMRRMPPIFVSPMSDQEVERIVAKFAKSCGESESIAKKCVEASKSITFLNNPDCAIEIADRAMAKAFLAERFVVDDDIREAAKSMEEIGKL